MNTLAATTYLRVGILIDTDDNTLARLNQIITQLIVLFSLVIVFWSKIESVVYLLSDVFTAVDYTVRVIAILWNTVRFAIG